MKNKTLLIYIKEKNDMIVLSYIGVSIDSPFQFKSFFGTNVPLYTIDYHFEKQFSKNDLENQEMVTEYKTWLIKKLEEYGYNNCNAIVNVELSCTFEGYILLPNLTGKALNDSLNQELYNIYGSFLESYDCEIIDTSYEGTLRKISIDFINNTQYKQLLDFISINNFYKISRINYTKDAFNNVFLLNKVKNNSAIGIFMNEDNINIAVYNGSQSISSKCLDFGFSDLFSIHNDEISINNDYYNQIVDSITNLMYSNRQNLDISTLLIVAPNSDNEELKNIVTEKFSKFIDNLKYVEIDSAHNYLVDMALVKNRKIRKLPLRVKI